MLIRYQLQRVQARDVLGRPVAVGFTRSSYGIEARQACIAMELGAGNCGEHAAVAFCLLWKRLSGTMLSYYAHSIDHAFVIIGFPPDENNAVVCDPWPRQAEAVLVRDFFVRFGIRGFRNIRYQATSSGGDLMAQARNGRYSDRGESDERRTRPNFRG
jgi:hypothetical protein